jgi:uncharacterized protein YkwD
MARNNSVLIALGSWLLLFCFESFTAVNDGGLTNDILSYTNKFRRTKDLPALVMRQELNEIAQQHSVNMAKGSVGFGHTGFNQRFEMARKKINGMKTFAENVAFGAKSAEQVVTLWKKSAEHRRNMLGKFKYVGIGAATNHKGVIYYTQVFAD